ncbi:MAG: 23S rRNA pseudouridine(955/2504/2580) synthase RluC [Gammaproteobacteria bacterium]
MSVVQTKVTYITIAEEDDGQRIDNFLVKKLKGLPKSHLYKLLRKGEVRVNKKRIKPEYRLQVGDSLRLPPMKLLPEKAKVAPNAHVLAMLSNGILFENDDFWVINKPSGIAVHGGSGINYGVVEAMRALYPKHKQLDLAHRLDRDTSGCLVIAKKRSSLKLLHDLFRDRRIKKFYWALTAGHWKNSELTVDLPLMRYELQSGERMVKVKPEGKPSKTKFQVIDRFDQAELVSAELCTGRTHQIRVHAAEREHPIAGDNKYGDKEFNQIMKKFGVKRLFLHARHLTIPWSEQTIEVNAPLNAEMQRVLEKL